MTTEIEFRMSDGSFYTLRDPHMIEDFRNGLLLNRVYFPVEGDNETFIRQDQVVAYICYDD